jgi:NhaP-type Na+/H+ or K+/H+ antiporter
MTGLLSRWWRMVVGIAAGVVAFAAVFVAVNGTSSTTHGAGGGEVWVVVSGLAAGILIGLGLRWRRAHQS